MTPPLSIGLDLDNTIIRYDRAFCMAARERGLVPKGFHASKQQVCDQVRAHGGETQWQALQGYVYGAGIGQAELFDGVTAFLAHARTQGAKLCIVSHKTQFGHFDPAKVDLRKAALEFLKARGIFAYIPENKIFFASTREEKIARIQALSCRVFVDDLPEVLEDPDFPANVRKLLFAPLPADKNVPYETCADWAQIKEVLFDAPARPTARP